VVQLVRDPAGRSVQARAGIDVPEEPFQVGFAGLRGEGSGAGRVTADQPHHVAVPVRQVSGHTQGHDGDVLLSLA